MFFKSNPFEQVRKRDGRLVPFDSTKIVTAVSRAMKIVEEGDLEKDPQKIAEQVVAKLSSKFSKEHVPTIEEIQDVVEEELILNEFAKTAKAYIVYRIDRAQIRAKKREIPANVKKLFDDSKKYFKNSLAEFVYLRTYSRWIEEEGRRETWIETVQRYVDFMKENLGNKLTDAEYEEVRQAILNQEAMPSMRLLQFAGSAARKNNITAYNCSFLAPSKIEDFAEIMFISMSGTGLGFSVESENVGKLPQIKKQTGEKLPTHVVGDSKEGWADALTFGLKTWFEGKDVDFDYSQVRPAGARLKTMGGQASGPEPLRQLLAFARNKILSKQNKHLSNIDVHDICCKIGMCVVAGGVRRSAMISLSDLEDEQMRDAKVGAFWNTESQRIMANNSAVYNEKPTSEEFLAEWLALVKSKAGERGIFSRSSLSKQMPERRVKLLGERIWTIGPNPCGEIYLQSKEYCNLSEVVCRKADTEETLMKKIRIATILGTYQSTLTNFPYLSKEWKKNCEEERLLGVSLTGQWDCPAVRNADTLRKLRDRTIEVNKEYAKRFGINESTAITCVKPSGNVSQTVDASSGLHPRHAKYYIRRVRIMATDALFHMMRDQKVPFNPEVGQAMGSANTYVVDFPVTAPDETPTKDEVTALEQLEYWKMVKCNFTEYNPSQTVSVGPNEWIEVANWLYENWDMVGGLSFLPREDYVYQLAPYETITEERYNELVAQMPDIDYSQILLYEQQDMTDVKKELACVGGVCSIDDAQAIEANQSAGATTA